MRVHHDDDASKCAKKAPQPGGARGLDSQAGRPERASVYWRGNLALPEPAAVSQDAMHLPPGDISPLLASLRYRLELRLTACGIELDWAVDVLGPAADAGEGAGHWREVENSQPAGAQRCRTLVGVTIIQHGRDISDRAPVASDHPLVPWF